MRRTHYQRIEADAPAWGKLRKGKGMRVDLRPLSAAVGARVAFRSKRPQPYGVWRVMLTAPDVPATRVGQ